MSLTVEQLDKSAKKIGRQSWEDGYYTHIFELWQKDNSFYQREIYYTGDDEGFDKVEEISEAQANEFIESKDFYKTM